MIMIADVSRVYLRQLVVSEFSRWRANWERREFTCDLPTELEETLLSIEKIVAKIHTDSDTPIHKPVFEPEKYLPKGYRHQPDKDSEDIAGDYSNADTTAYYNGLNNAGLSHLRKMIVMLGTVLTVVGLPTAESTRVMQVLESSARTMSDPKLYTTLDGIGRLTGEFGANLDRLDGVRETVNEAVAQFVAHSAMETTQKRDLLMDLGCNLDGSANAATKFVLQKQGMMDLFTRDVDIHAARGEHVGRAESLRPVATSIKKTSSVKTGRPLVPTRIIPEAETVFVSGSHKRATYDGAEVGEEGDDATEIPRDLLASVLAQLPAGDLGDAREVALSGHLDKTPDEELVVQSMTSLAHVKHALQTREIMATQAPDGSVCSTPVWDDSVVGIDPEYTVDPSDHTATDVLITKDAIIGMCAAENAAVEGTASGVLSAPDPAEPKLLWELASWATAAAAVGATAYLGYNLFGSCADVSKDFNEGCDQISEKAAKAQKFVDKAHDLSVDSQGVVVDVKGSLATARKELAGMQNTTATMVRTLEPVTEQVTLLTEKLSSTNEQLGALKGAAVGYVSQVAKITSHTTEGVESCFIANDIFNDQCVMDMTQKLLAQGKLADPGSVRDATRALAILASGKSLPRESTVEGIMSVKAIASRVGMSQKVIADIRALPDATPFLQQLDETRKTIEVLTTVSASTASELKGVTALAKELKRGVASASEQLAAASSKVDVLEVKLGEITKATIEASEELTGLQTYVKEFKARITGKLQWLKSGGIGTFILNKLMAMFPSQKSIVNVVYQHILEPIDDLQASLHAQIDDLNTAFRDRDVSALLSSIVGFFNTLLNIKYVMNLLGSIMTIVKAVFRVTGKVAVAAGGILHGAAKKVGSFAYAMFHSQRMWQLDDDDNPEKTEKIATGLASDVEHDNFAAAHDKVMQEVDGAKEFVKKAESASPESPDIGAKSRECTRDIARNASIGKYRASAVRSGVSSHGLKFIRSTAGKMGKMVGGTMTSYDMLVGVPADVHAILGSVMEVSGSDLKSAAQTLVSYGGRLWGILETVCAKITTVFTVAFRFIGKHKVAFGVAAITSAVVLSLVGSLEAAKLPAITAALVTVRKVGGWISSTKLFSAASALYRLRSRFKTVVLVIKLINLLTGLVGVGISSASIAPVALGIVAAYSGYKFYRHYAAAGNKNPLSITAQSTGITVKGSPSTVGRTLRFMHRGVDVEMRKLTAAETLEISWARTPETKTLPHIPSDVTYESTVPKEPIVGARSIEDMFFSESKGFIDSAIVRMQNATKSPGAVLVLPIQETTKRVFDVTSFAKTFDPKYTRMIIPVAITTQTRGPDNKAVLSTGVRVVSITASIKSGVPVQQIVTFLNNPKDVWRVVYPEHPDRVAYNACYDLNDDGDNRLKIEETIMYQIYILLLQGIPVDKSGNIRSPTRLELEMIRSCFM